VKFKIGLPIMTYTAYAPVQTQGYAPTAQNYVPVPVQSVPKPLTEAQIVFTIVNSEIAKFKRQGQDVDARATKAAYQQHYTGWNQQQLIQAALNLVQVYDQTTKQWRLILNEQELRGKQQEFSKRYNYFKNRSVAA
jgi:anaerobic ribonucleoside-triphosphate reductase